MTFISILYAIFVVDLCVMCHILYDMHLERSHASHIMLSVCIHIFLIISDTV